MRTTPIHESAAHRCSSMIAALFVCAMVSVGTGSAQSAPEPAVSVVGSTRTVLEKWVETRRIISKERSDWSLGQRMLQERIELMKRQIESLRKGIADTEKSIGETDKVRLELVEKQERLVEAAAGLEEAIAPLEKRTLELLVRLPDPIREKVKPASQSIPKDPEATDLGLGLRFQNVAVILQEVDKFNREVTVTSEIRPLDDGSTAEVTAIYFGIGQGYYVGIKGNAAGVGTPSDQGWTWAPSNLAADRIAKAIAIHKNETPAEFVQLPIRIR